MDYNWCSRQSLHERLNESLSKSRKECCRLNGSISKLKSGQAVLMMRRDRAKTDLESYVNKLSTALLDFQSEMLLTIREALGRKVNDLDKLREKYEERIDSYLQLCSEAEKLTQFGREIESPADKNSAVKILETFKSMLASSSDDNYFDDILKLEFYPALQSTEIKPPMFGELVVGQCYKSPTFALSALRARDCGQDNLRKMTDGQKSTKSADMATQTDNYIEKQNTSYNNTELVTDQNNNATLVVSEPCSKSKRVTPPPGMNHAYVSHTFSNRNYTSPPPGFNAFSPINNMQANMQMNPYLLNNNYCNPIPSLFVPQFQAVSVSPPLQSLQVPVVYQFGDTNITSDFTFQAQPSSVSLCSSKRNISGVPPPAARNITKIGKMGGTENSCVRNTDLSVGPAPKSATFSNVSTDRLNPSVLSDKGDLEAKNISTLMEHGKQNLDTDFGALTKSADENCHNKLVENVHELNANSNTNETADEVHVSIDNKRPSEVDEKKVYLDDAVIEHGKKRRNRVAAELYQSIVNRTKALELESEEDQIDFVQRTDESESSFKPTEIDSIDGRNSSGEVNGIFGEQMKSCSKSDFVQTAVSSDLNERIVKIKTSFPMKPLRKPFPKTDFLMNVPKTIKGNYIKDSGKSFDGSKKDLLSQGTSDKCQTLRNEQGCISASSEPVLNNLNVDRHENGAEVHDNVPIPDLLNISITKPKSLRELVSANYPPSKKEVEQRSKEMLLAQRSWFKGFMQKKLEKSKIDKKEDKKVVDKVWRDVKVKTDYVEPTDTKFDVSHEISDLNKDAKSSKVDMNIDVKCERPDSDWEINSIEGDVKSDHTKSFESDTKLEVLCERSDSNREIKSFEGPPPLQGHKSKSNVEKIDKGGFETEEGVAVTAEDNAHNGIAEIEETKKNDKEGHEKLQHKCDARKVDAENVQVENIAEKNTESKNDSTAGRKSSFQHFTNGIEDYLDGKKDTGKRTSASCSKRLGALQAHWVGRRGTNVKAKHIFTCSSDLHFPIGATTNSCGDIIVTDTGNHCVKMFDSEGKFVKVFGNMINPSLRRPSAVVVNEFDNIYVKDDSSIRVFDQTGQYVKSIGLKLFSKPFGLVLTPTKCLLVLETDRRHPALVHISQDGSQVWRYLYTPLTTAHPNSKCRFMAVSENNVIVSDLGLSVVYITTFEGVFLRTIGGYGFGVRDFCEPSGLSVDIYGNVVIGDSKNNRVQVYRHDGSYTGLIEFDDKIVRPSGIHLTKDNRLLVVSLLQHDVKVYELQ